MLRTFPKLVLLAGAACLVHMQRHTATPADAAEWESCLQSLNAEGYLFVRADSPKELMRGAHWQLYLDSYTLQASNYTPKLWRIELHPKDVQLMLRAHRHPEYRATLPPKLLAALREAEAWVASLTSPGMPDLDKARALHDALVTTCTYSLDGATDATDMLRLHTGTCEAYGRTLQLLCGIAGIPCRLVYGTVTDGTTGWPVRHCWNQVFIDGRWLYTDPSWDAADSTPTSPSQRYFAVPAATLRPTHIWEE